MLKQELQQPLSDHHPVVVLVFALVPSLAIATTFWRGLYLAAIGFFTLVICSICMVLLRRLVPEKLRLLVVVILASAVVTAVDQVLSGYMPYIRLSLGIYVGLFAVNGLIISRTDMSFRRFTMRQALYSSIIAGLAFGTALLVLSSLREIVGSASLAGISGMAHYLPMQFFVSPAGGFLMAGLLLWILLMLCRRDFKS